MARDRVWSDMYTAAERMTAKYSFPVAATSRREGLRRVQGLATRVPESFEAVRRRRLFTRRWHQLQGVDAAANRVGTLLAGASENCTVCDHPVGLHPGYIPASACARCIEAEDNGEIGADEMCRKEYARPDEP